MTGEPESTDTWTAAAELRTETLQLRLQYILTQISVTTIYSSISWLLVSFFFLSSCNIF